MACLRRLARARMAASIRSSSWRIHSGPIQVAGVRLRAALRRAIRRRRDTRPKESIHAVHESSSGSPPLARCSRSQLQPSAPMRCRSAIPAPPRRFRKMPGRRRRKCIGGTIAITVGIAGTIIIATTIIATGAAGECDSLAQRSSRPASSRACFDSKNCLETGEIAARYLCHRDQREESVMKSLIGAAFVAGALAVAGPAAISPVAAAPQAKAQAPAHPTPPISARTAMSGATIVTHGYHRPYYPSLLLRSAGLLSAVSLFRTGAVHLRHRVRSALVMRRWRAKCSAIAFIFAVGAFMARSRACL